MANLDKMQAQTETQTQEKTETETLNKEKKLAEIVLGKPFNLEEISVNNAIVLAERKELVNRILPCEKTYLITISRNPKVEGEILEKIYENSEQGLVHAHGGTTTIEPDDLRYNELNDLLRERLGE